MCQDREFVLVQQNGDWLAKECECRKAKTLQRLIKSSGLTPVLREKTFDNFKPSSLTLSIHQAGQEYVREYPSIRQERNNGLGLTGTVGTGKTHILVAIANNLLTKGIPVVFVYTPDLIAELRQAQFKDNDIDGKMDAISKAEVVIFDDLGKEKSSEWVQTQYSRIINHRYTYGLPTLFSSNLTMDELSDKVGDASASRLYSICKGRIVDVPIGTEDYRLNE